MWNTPEICSLKNYQLFSNGDELELTFARRSEEIKNTLKNSQIEVDQTLKEYRRDGAIELLASFGEVPMNEDELSELKESIQHLKPNMLLM